MKLFIYFLLLFNFFHLKGANLDELLHISTFKNSRQQIDHLNELSFLYLTEKNNIDSCIYYANEAYEKALSISYLKGEADSHIRLGLAHENLQKYRIALAKYEKGRKIREQLKDYSGIANVLINIANTYAAIGNQHRKLQAFQDALEIQTFLNDSLEMAFLNLDVGESFRFLFQYDKAIQHIIKSQELFYLLNNAEGVGVSQLNIAQIEVDKHHYTSALKNLEKALINLKQDTFYLINIKNTFGNIYYQQRQFRAALSYYFEVHNLQQKRTYASALSNTLSNIGSCYRGLQQIPEALKYHQKSLALSQQNNNLMGMVNSYRNIGFSYKIQKEHSKALNFLRKSYYQSKINSYSNIQLESSIFLADIFSQEQNYDSAYYYSSIYNVLKDSLLKNEQQTTQLLTQQENKIELLEANYKLTNEKLANKTMQSTLEYILFGFFAVVGILCFWVWRERQRKLLAQKDKIIAEQRIDTVIQEQETKSIKAQLKGQEKIKQEISRELHDRIGVMLTTVKLYYKTAGETLDQAKLEASEYYTKANSLLDETCDEIRRLSHDLSSSVLLRFGLVKALDSLCERLSGTGHINIEFFEVGLNELELKQEVALELYRIIQELLGNVLKHASANEVTIQLSYYNEEKELNLIVEDDGTGFDPTHFKEGIGLNNIILGVQSLKGVMDIDSGKGAGTTVNIQIPISDQH